MAARGMSARVSDAGAAFLSCRQPTPAPAQREFLSLATKNRNACGWLNHAGLWPLRNAPGVVTVGERQGVGSMPLGLNHGDGAIGKDTPYARAGGQVFEPRKRG